MKLPIFIKIKGRKSREGHTKGATSQVQQDLEDQGQGSNELKTSDEIKPSTATATLESPTADDQIQSKYSKSRSKPELASRSKSKSSKIDESASDQKMDSNKPDKTTLKMDENSSNVDPTPEPKPVCSFFPEVFPVNDANNNETQSQGKDQQNGDKVNNTPTVSGRSSKVEFNLEILSIDRSPRESLVRLLDPLKSTSKYALVKNPSKGQIPKGQAGTAEKGGSGSGGKSSTLEEILKPRIIPESKEVMAYCGYDCDDCCWTGCRSYNYCRPAFPWNNCDPCGCPTVPRKLLPYVRKTLPDPCGDVPLLPPEPDPPKQETAPIADEKKGSILGKIGSSISSSMSKIGSSMSSIKSSVSKSFNKSEGGGGAGGSQMSSADSGIAPTTKVYMMGQTVYSKSAAKERNDRFLKFSRPPREFDEDYDEDFMEKDSNYDDILDQLNNNLSNGSDSKMMLNSKMKSRSRPETGTKVKHLLRVPRSARSKYSKKEQRERETADDRVKAFMEDEDDFDDEDDVFLDKEVYGKSENHPYDNDYFLRAKTPKATSNPDQVTSPRNFTDKNGNKWKVGQNHDDGNKNKMEKSYREKDSRAFPRTKMIDPELIQSDFSFRKDDDENFFDSFRRPEGYKKVVHSSSKVPWCTNGNKKLSTQSHDHAPDEYELINDYLDNISKVHQHQLQPSMPSVRKIRNLDEMDDDPTDQRFPSHRIYQRDKQVFPKQIPRKFRPPPAPKNSCHRTRSRDYYNRILTSSTNADSNANAKNTSATSARRPSGASQAMQNRLIVAKYGTQSQNLQSKFKFPPQGFGLYPRNNDDNNNTECFVQLSGMIRGDRKYTMDQNMDKSGGKVLGGGGGGGSSASGGPGGKKPGKKVAKADAEMKEYMPPDEGDEDNFHPDPPKPPSSRKTSASEGGEENEDEEGSSNFPGEDEIDYDLTQAVPPEPKCISLKPKNGRGLPKPPQPDDFCKCNEKEFRKERRRLVKQAKMSNMPGWRAPVFGTSYYPYGEGPGFLSDEDSSYNEDIDGPDVCATSEQRLLRLKKDRCCDPLLPLPKPCLLCNEECRKLLRVRKQRRKFYCNVLEPPKSPKYFEDIPVDFPKDYVRFNALKVMQTPAATPKAKIVLTRNGDKVDFCKSGLARLFVTRPGFGTVPNYIKCRKRELEFCTKMAKIQASKNKSKGTNTRTNKFGYTKPLKRKATKRSRSTSASRSMSTRSKSSNRAHKGPYYF